MKRSTFALVTAGLLLGLQGSTTMAQQIGSAGADLYFPPTLTSVEKGKALQISRSFTSIPVLPMIFFDEPGGTDIPDRYFDTTADLTVLERSGQMLVGGLVVDLFRPETALDPYHQILHLLALRLMHYGESRLTLTGCFSDEKNESQAVALARAGAVRNRLVESYGIDPLRITVAPPRQALPDPSDTYPNIEDFREEARRVEITTDSPRLLDDMVVAVREVHTQTISFEFSLQHYLDSSEISSIEFETRVGGESLGNSVVYPQKGQGIYRFHGEWEIPGSVLSNRPAQLTLMGTVTLKDNTTRETTSLTMPLTYRLPGLPDPSRIPERLHAGASDEVVVGTLFFDEGESQHSESSGLTIEHIIAGLRRGKVALVAYHPIDEEGSIGNTRDYGPARITISLPDSILETEIAWGCAGFGFLPKYPIYSQGVIGDRKEGQSPENSRASQRALSLAEERTRLISRRTAELMQRQTTEEGEIETLINPHRYLGMTLLVQNTQTIYPTSLPEGRFYRRGVRLAARY